MQRKNSLLRAHNSPLKNKKNAMAMIMAIAVIVVIATIMALSMAMTAKTTKSTTDLYLYEQTILLSKSATEYALLQIANNLPCTNLNTSFPQDTFYTIDIQIQYIYYDDPATALINEAQAVCDALPIANRGTLYTTVTTPEQNGSVILDITVSVPDDIGVTTEPIRYFRRTIQKL